MKKTILLIASLFISIALLSQTLSNQLLGYQEPYAQITSQVVDSAGNIYYAGTFKASLILNNQTVFDGNGGDDVFIVKTKSNGDLIWAKKVGDSGNQNAGNMTLYNGSLYLTMTLSQTSQIDGVTYTSYGTGIATSLIAKLDTTAGNFIWVRKNSLPSGNIVAAGNILYMYGLLTPLASGTLYFENNLLQEYSSQQKLTFLYLDTSGNYQGNKTLTTFITGTIINILSPHGQKDGKLMFLLNALSAQNIQVGAQSFNFPTRNNYQILIKTDTSLNFQYKVLNPLGEGYTNNLYAENSGFSMNSARDSIYMILGGTSNVGSYKLDGFDVPIGDQSVLLVLDSSLVSARLKPLNIHRMNGIPYRAALSHVVVDSNNYYFKGRVTGNNSALPRLGFPEQKVELELLFGLKDTVDINGVSRSFLIKTTKDIQLPVMKWIGNHSLYESPTLVTSSFTLRKDKLLFFHFMDNVWNPWIIDTSFAIIKGSMKGNADRGETTNYVKYFSDGSKVIIGTAKGKTALDKDSSNIISGQLKNDLFFVLLDKNEQISWYKRMSHSFGAVSLQKIVTQSDKIYLSFTLNLPRNTGAANYIQIDTSTFFITPTTPLTSGIIILNRSGKVSLLKLPAPFHTANVFDVFQDGDLAVASLLTSTGLTLPGKTFPSFNGFYVARFDTLGVIKDAVKFTAGGGGTTLLNATDIIVDGSINGFKMIANTSISPGYPANNFVFLNGISAAVSFTVANPLPTASLNKSYFLVTSSNFSELKTHAVVGPANGTTKSSATIKNKHYLFFAKSNSQDSIYYNKTLIIPDNHNNVRFLLNVDTSLKYRRHKVISSSNDLSMDVSLSHLTVNGYNIYASGTSFTPTAMDTIQIGNGGLTDAITIQFDTTLAAKRLFRLSSPYNEQMYGCDIYLDSLISFAYTTQGNPAFINGRFAARNTAESTDLDENAYIQTVLLKTGVVTSVDEPLRVEGFKLFPNPVLSNLVVVDLGNTEAGRYQWLLYNTEGRLIENNMLMWSPGQTKQIQFNNRLQAGNYVLVIKSGQQRTLKAVKLTVL